MATANTYVNVKRVFNTQPEAPPRRPPPMIWLPIELFISSGFDHLVVNEFLIPGGIIVGGSYIDSRVNFLNAFWNNFIPVTIGSVIGAWFLVFPFWLVNKDGWEAKLKREAEAAGVPAEKLTEA